jgi:hypothetical protein
VPCARPERTLSVQVRKQLVICVVLYIHAIVQDLPLLLFECTTTLKHNGTPRPARLHISPTVLIHKPKCTEYIHHVDTGNHYYLYTPKCCIFRGLEKLLIQTYTQTKDLDNHCDVQTIT